MIDPTFSGRERALRLLLAAVLGLLIVPRAAASQFDAGVGILIAHDEGPNGSLVGPAGSIGATTVLLGIPLRFTADFARIDFTSLGQDYHDTHLGLALNSAWVLGDEQTRAHFGLGLGAYRESQTVEGAPDPRGGTNWFESFIPRVAVERRLGGERRLRVEIADHMLGWFFALADAAEYGVEHRIFLTAGLIF